MNLEEKMLSWGWKKIVRTNCGVDYIEFHKDGLIIEESDITVQD
jgi:hypothetical protein